MDERVRFIGDYQRDWFSFSELCRRYGVSRKTGYKWIARYDAEGPSGLEEKSRRPGSCPHATDPRTVEFLLEARRRHPSWGPKKLVRVLRKRHPSVEWPARSTCCDILRRHGLIRLQRRRRTPSHPGPPLSAMDAPNAVWTADFKGEFRTRDGRYCYPLTVADGFSRFLLACQGLRSTAVALARPVFRRLFVEYGLPSVIRSDNGVPFATTALGRLSALSVWWIRLGIYPELIEPSHPQQNGCHERMHRTLKAEATRPASASLSSQQVRFNRFRLEYNDERPHEAIDLETPASLYTPSPRAFPRRLPDVEYPGHYEVRYVSANGGIRWKCAWVNVTTTLIGEHVGLEEVGDGLWDVYFSFMWLGRLDERRMRIEDRPGRWTRRKLSPMSPD